MTAPPPDVLFLSLPPAPGGSVQALVALLAALSGSVRRTVATPAPSLSSELLAPVADRIVALADNRRLRLRGQVSAWVQGRRHVRATPPAVVHANGLAELPTAAAIASGAPVVVWVHGTEVPAGTRLSRPLWRRGDVRWVGVSEFSRRMLADAGLARPEEVVTVPNPIDPAVIAPVANRSGRPTVLYLGGASERKGFDVVSATVQRLRDRPLDWIVITGRRPPDALRRHIGELSGAVELVDHVDRVAELYARADVVLMPSRSESFGRVAAEAMLNGLPVVASDIPALAETVQGGGVLVPVGDVDATAAAVEALAADPDRRHRLGEIGRGLADAYRPERVARAMREVYGLPDVLSHKPRA
jgi:glycosyltransferase involved in cell wall biosynthesis